MQVAEGSEDDVRLNVLLGETRKVLASSEFVRLTKLCTTAALEVLSEQLLEAYSDPSSGIPLPKIIPLVAGKSSELLADAGPVTPVLAQIQELNEKTEPFDALKELFALRLERVDDPSGFHTDFNTCLRDAWAAGQTLPTEDDAKRQCLRVMVYEVYDFGAGARRTVGQTRQANPRGRTLFQAGANQLVDMVSQLKNMRRRRDGMRRRKPDGEEPKLETWTPRQPPGVQQNVWTGLQDAMQRQDGVFCDGRRSLHGHHGGLYAPAVIEPPAVVHAPTGTIEPDEPAMPYPKQFVDGEPPFEAYFMDRMSVQLGFNEPEQKVSANSFTPLPPWISSTNDSAVMIETNFEDDGEGSGADAMPEQFIIMLAFTWMWQTIDGIWPLHDGFLNDQLDLALMAYGAAHGCGRPAYAAFS
ncbi:hypothetical protein CYMTET_12271 [Cymbomonas tetramitiformis]|uniref:Uncharacterized protein n=1 Tax=Cymbomonas tetramitiformis TaxID=36881 RepID=A0AAE0LC04_9CHLO|nr:hypothetical protein CYMTET_12271 [Cymbomonas tetramitiformis]